MGLMRFISAVATYVVVKKIFQMLISVAKNQDVRHNHKSNQPKYKDAVDVSFERKS
jgi:hypothetical protein